jgi:virginiamycin B lyase
VSTRELSSVRRSSPLALGAVLALLVGLLAVVHTALAPASVAAGPTAYPVPTSAAGLGRIVTAPNGDMWFTEEDVNKIGRITPAGQITEFSLPPVSGTGDTSDSIVDLDVTADNTVWVVYDSGRRARSLNIVTQVVSPEVWLDPSERPYGEEVEIGADGSPWISMSYDVDGLARIVGVESVWHVNAPPCDGALARAADGAMWCQSDDRLIRSNADASGGTTYPLPDGLADPYSLAAGPTGSMWFARFFSGTWISKPDSGDVGWIDQASGRTTIFNTGEDTAPFSLTRGPDNNMWFTSIGDARGIGHLDARGRGALTQVGNYEPRYLTFGQDGAVWFTDSANNSIVRVDRSELQRTNVDPGAGSVFAPVAPAAPLGTVAGARKPLKVTRGAVPLRVACPKGGPTCTGKAVLQHPKRNQAWSAAKKYAVKPGKTATLRAKLTKAGTKAIGRKSTKARVTLSGGGARTSKPVKVRR